MADSSKLKAIRGPRTTYYQQMAMIEWLGNGTGRAGTKNFDIIVGRAQALKPNQMVCKLALNSFSHMMSWVNQKCGFKWTKDQNVLNIA